MMMEFFLFGFLIGSQKKFALMFDFIDIKQAFTKSSSGKVRKLCPKENNETIIKTESSFYLGFMEILLFICSSLISYGTCPFINLSSNPQTKTKQKTRTNGNLRPISLLCESRHESKIIYLRCYPLAQILHNSRGPLASQLTTQHIYYYYCALCVSESMGRQIKGCRSGA